MKRPIYVTQERLNHFISEAFKEDVGDGDHSTLGSVPADLIDEAQLLIKENCVLAGVELAKEIFKHFDENLSIEVLKQDGEWVEAGDIAFYRSEEHTSELQSRENLVCRLLLEKK